MEGALENIVADDGIMEAAVVSSVETGMERALSAIFESDGKGGKKVRKLTAEEKRARAEAAQLKRVEQDKDQWIGKGLGLLKNGSVPKGDAAVKHAALELLRGALRGAGMGIGLKALLSLVFSLAKGRRFALVSALKEAFGKNTRDFGLFLGVFTGAFRGLNAAFTSWSGEDKPANSFFAGLIAGGALLLDEAGQRKTVALYLFSRSLDLVAKRLCRDGVVPHLPWFEAFMFGVSNMPIMYGFLFMPEILVPSYYKWILSMGNFTDPKGLVATLIERRDAWFKRGEKIPFRRCSHGYHEGPCTPYCIMDWFGGLLRAAKIYLPVHLLPLVLFRYKSLINDPKDQLLHSAKGFISSCMFLSTYVFCVKSSQCFLRNARQRDSGWHALISGMLTGLATYFETKSRVSELMLYCVPRGMEATWNYMEINGMVKSIKNFEAVFFCIAMAVLTSSSKADYKLTYFQGLGYLMGSKDERPVAKKDDSALVPNQKQE